MTTGVPIQRVEVSFVGAAPARQIERASGVTEVDVDGPVVRCVVIGSFQPFLEALRGHEVISLTSAPVSCTDPVASSPMPPPGPSAGPVG